MNKRIITMDETVARPQDVPLGRVPWKDMKVGGIYQRKDGRYYIYAGRANTTHTILASRTDFGEKYYYTYIYLDYPTVLTEDVDTSKLRIIASSAKIRTSEYRDIAEAQIGMLPGFAGQSVWEVADFTIYTDPKHISGGSKKAKVKFSAEAAATFKVYEKKAELQQKRKRASRKARAKA